MDKHKIAANGPNTTRRLERCGELSTKPPRKTIVREVKLSSNFVERIVQGNVRYKSYVVQRGQLMSAQTKDNRLIRANLLLSNLKYQEPGMLCLLLNEKSMISTKKSTE